MKSLKLLLAGLASVLAAGAAKAADLAQKPILKAPPAAAMPAFSWTGCYAGLNGGGAWGRDPIYARSAAAITGSSYADVHTASAILGGQAGCDLQFSGKWVIGLEGQLDGTNLSGQGNIALFPGNAGQYVQTQTRWLGSVTGRLGYADLIPHTLVYVKGGAAWAGDKYVINVNAGALNGTFDQTPFGWTMGGGLEWAIDPRWSIFLEYDHYDFSRQGFNSTAPGVADTITINGPTIDAVEVGFNYRFLGR